MFRIKYDQTMEFSQGDICNFAISFSDYNLTDKDRLIFVIKKDEVTLLKKEVYKIVDNVAHFKIDSKDTLNIEIGTFKYYLGIKPYNMEGFNILVDREIKINRGVINEL